MFISAKSALAGAVQRILADADSYTYPVQIEVKRAEKRLSGARQAELQCRIRDIARHAQALGIPATEAAVKIQMKRGEIAGIEWPGKHRTGFNGTEVWEPKETMDLTQRECADLLDQIGEFMAEHNIPATAPEHWTE
jgi:hypothetical protein